MRCRAILGCFTVLAGLTAGAIAAGPWRPILGEAEYKTLVAAESRSLNDTLAKGIDEKKMALRARNSAMMLAAYAQAMAAGSTAKKQMYFQHRDGALKLAAAIAANKADEAKTLAKGVEPTASAKASVPEKMLDLSKDYELGDLMTQFKPEKGGGRELEKKIKATMQKRAALSADEMKDAVVTAYMTAIIAQYTEAMAPATDAGAKKKGDWIKWSVEMEEAGVAAAKLAGAAKPDDKAVKAAFKKLDETCNKCHAVFRD